jgi:hypothetical protein
MDDLRTHFMHHNNHINQKNHRSDIDFESVFKYGNNLMEEDDYY